jgi:hypothetical protein
MKILIETIPHSEQRYPTVGDWQWKSSRTKDFYAKGKDPKEWSDKDTLVIRVSSLSDWRYEALVGLHEAIEALLCKHVGVSEQDVDYFDQMFEEHRGDDDSLVGEPGDHPAAPYHVQHVWASDIEQIFAKQLDVNWSAYSAEVDSL